MAVNYGINLANGEIIGAALTPLYTAPGSVTRTIINQARLVNYTAGAITIDLYVFQPSETTADNFKAIDTLSLAANTTKLVTEIIGDAIETGGSIQAVASAGSSVSFSATGTEFT